MIKKGILLSNFVLRHFVASIVSVVAPVVLLVITYVVLFVIAIITNSSLGSPIALPLWIAIIAVISVLYTAILLFPTALLAEAIARFFGKWQHIAQIPISTLVLLVLVYALSLIVRLHPNYSEIDILHWANHPLVIFLILTIPLGFYWWTMKIVQTGVTLPIVLFRKLIKPSDSKE